MIGRLGFNEEINRFGILVSDLWENEGLYCGDIIEVFINDKWMKDTIEKNSQGKWYLVKNKMVDNELEYVKVKIKE